MSAEDFIDSIPGLTPEEKTYRDFSRLLSDPKGFDAAMEEFIGMFDREIFDVFVCSESYGGMFATALARKLGKTVVPVRYEGGFPGTAVSEPCVNSKGSTKLEMRPKCILPGTKAVILADVLATGRTTAAMIRLVESQGGEVVRIGYIAELTEHGARKNKVLKGYPFECLATF